VSVNIEGLVQLIEDSVNQLTLCDQLIIY